MLNSGCSLYLQGDQIQMDPQKVTQYHTCYAKHIRIANWREHAHHRSQVPRCGVLTRTQQCCGTHTQFNSNAHGFGGRTGVRVSVFCSSVHGSEIYNVYAACMHTYALVDLMRAHTHTHTQVHTRTPSSSHAAYCVCGGGAVPNIAD